MKTHIQVILAMLVLIIAVQFAYSQEQLPPPDTGNDSDAVGYFYNLLLPYGEWVLLPSNDWVWYPYNMPVGWRPYTDGYWENTDYGWTWVSDLPWGWACFHYGRWEYNDDYGWVWYPGLDWAPAWVVWRYSDDYIGWAPCPRRLIWHADFGFDLNGIDLDDIVRPHTFCFVDVHHFLDRDIRRQIIPRARNGIVLKQTKPFAQYHIENRRIINQLPIDSHIEQIYGRPIPRIKIAEAKSPVLARTGRMTGNELQIYKPDFRTLPPQERLQFRHMPPVPVTTQPPEVKVQQPAEQRALEQQRQAEQKALDRQHQAEQKALEQQHAAAKKMMEEQQRIEIKKPPSNIPIPQLQQQHEAERKALEEQMQSERKIMQNQQERENWMRTAPQAPPQRRYNIEKLQPALRQQQR